MNINSLLISSTAGEAPTPPPKGLRGGGGPTPSPASASKLPTPPLSTQKPLQKRKREEKKPAWAIREDEPSDIPLGRPHKYVPKVPPPNRPTPPPGRRPGQQHPPQPGSHNIRVVRELQGYERPITDPPRVYDEISLVVCEFLDHNMIQNDLLRHAAAETPGTQIEIEAKWGQIKSRTDNNRLQGIHMTECVLRPDLQSSTRFESTMSIEQHKKLNQYLNSHFIASGQPGARRPKISYSHPKEIDTFYDLDQTGFDMLPPLTRQILQQTGQRQRIRVTRDIQTNQVTNKIIKVRLHNLEISSPRTEWDYRISINLEIQYPGPAEELKPVREGPNGDILERKKDRMTYSWLDTYKIDLTQVRTSTALNHELELEVDTTRLSEAYKNSELNEFEEIVTGMVNNLRVISRQLTTAPPF